MQTWKYHFHIWWQAARPPFYIATLIPVFLGFTLAGHDLQSWDYVGLSGILLLSLLVHLATNLANDLFDHVQGADSADSIGGSRVLQEGKITPRAIVIALILLYGTTIYGTYVGAKYFSLPKLWYVMGFALFSSYFYVAPPIRYGYRACGELFVFLNMGVCMVCGIYYAFVGVVSLQSVLLAFAVGTMVAGILYYQSIPDIATDLAVKKYTVANLIGLDKSLTLLKLWWPTLWLYEIILFFFGFTSWPSLIAIALSIPLFIQLLKKIGKDKYDNVKLDIYGEYIRKMYLIGGLGLIISIFV